MKISVVLPCQNEEQTIGQCIMEIKKTLKGMDYEIIVSDSSTDKSPEIARRLGAIVVRHERGYGNAYKEGLKHANGHYIIMGDSDGTYDFSEIPLFLEELQKGYDFVIGNRFTGQMQKGSMPMLHKYIGNPFLTWLLNVTHGGSLGDVHCGFRAIKRDALQKLDLQSDGMEFASEMIIKALRQGMKIIEIPVSYRRRVGRSKMRSLRDGWRHVRFITYSRRGA